MMRLGGEIGCRGGWLVMACPAPEDISSAICHGSGLRQDYVGDLAMPPPCVVLILVKLD
jgi:hypothetical protein